MKRNSIPYKLEEVIKEDFNTYIPLLQAEMGINLPLLKDKNVVSGYFSADSSNDSPLIFITSEGESFTEEGTSNTSQGKIDAYKINIVVQPGGNTALTQEDIQKMFLAYSSILQLTLIKNHSLNGSVTDVQLNEAEVYDALGGNPRRKWYELEIYVIYEDTI